MQADPAIMAQVRVRRAYEWGRLRSSLPRAALVVSPIAILALALTGRAAMTWLPVTMTCWVFAYWRGGPLLRGSFFGLVAGVITYLLPMSVLRPCCTPEAMTAAAQAGRDCCTMPGACLGAGAAVGFLFSMLFAAGSESGGASRWRMACGMAIGVASVAILRCSTLFLGEAIGLVGGLVAGVLAATMSKSFVRARLA